MSVTVSSPTEASGGAGRWFSAAVVLVVLTEQTALGINLIAPAMLGIAQTYDTTQVVWVITLFTLVGSVVTPIAGKLGDAYGKRKVLVAAALASLVGAVVAAIAPNFALLLFGRALMGAAFIFLPVSIALIRDVFPCQYRNVSIGIATNGVGFVTIAGPFIAGFLIDTFGVPSLFWFMAILSTVGAVGILALVPESSVRTRSRIDYVGALWLVVSLLLVMFGVSQLGQWALTDLRTVATVGAGTALMVGWWIYETRVEAPFIDTKVISQRPVASLIAVYSLYGAGVIVTASFLPSMLQTPRDLTGGVYGFGLDATGVAVYMVPAGLLTVASGLLVGFASRRFDLRPFLFIGSSLLVCAGLMIGLMRSQPWMPITGWALGGISAMVWAAGAGLLMVVAPAKMRSTTMGMLAALSGILSSVLTQVASLILNSGIVTVTDEGLPIYSAAGVASPYLIAAGTAAIAFVVATLVPRKSERPVAEESESPQPLSAS
ncbi:MFS transporter [Rhodococcus triatomae]